MDLIERRNSKTNLRMLSIGYPDLIYPLNNYKTKFFDIYKCFPGSSKALKWHNKQGHLYQNFSIEKYVNSRGWTFEYVDLKQGTGDDKNFVQLDLNHNIPNSYFCSYDIVIDSGTAEHCFNIGKVFENYFYLLKPGGYMLQYLPFFSPNHGFWSVNPTLIFDIAKDNPLDIKHFKLKRYATYESYFECKYDSIEYLPHYRFGCSSDLNDVVLAEYIQKKTFKSIFKYPVQTKYRDLLK